MCAVASPSAVASQEKNSDSTNAAAAPRASSTGVITLPNGKPVETQLAQSVSTATSKVGDEVKLTVTHAVLQDDLVIIPKGAVLSARITSVRHPGRPLKDGRVRLSVEKAVLPGGEIAALRPQPPNAAKSFGHSVRTMGYIAEGPGLPPGGGILMLAISPVVFLWKGREREFDPGETVMLYVHGPVSLKREAVLQIQPPPYKGPAEVFYANRTDTKEAHMHKEFYCGRRYLGDVAANDTLQLELSPGAYWLSAGNDGKEKVRVEIEADHRYYIERKAQGLFIKNFDDNPGLLEEGPSPNNLDFTSASPEVTSDLLAMPPYDETTQGSH